MKSRVRALITVVVAGLGGVLLIPGEASANGCGVPFTGMTYEFSLPSHFVSLASCDPTWRYTLTADVDLAGVMVGRRTNFTGTFDGNGYTISNLSVTGSGLFDVGLAGAAFTRVRLHDATVRGGGGNGWAGALVREASGPVTITNSSFSGSVAAGRVGNDWAGGFIGEARDNVTISASYFSGSVGGSTLNGWAGGFVGRVTDFSPGAPSPVVALARNYMLGTIAGGDGGNSWAAGFVGSVSDASITVTDSFVRASLAGGSGGNSWANGFIGDGGMSSTALSNVYFEGSLTAGTGGNSWATGIIDGAPGGSVVRAFCVTSCGPGEGQALGSLADLRTAIVGAGWDLSNTWCYSYGHNDGYPVLKGLTHGPNAAWGNCVAAPPPPPETSTTTSTTTTSTTVACQVAPVQFSGILLQPGEHRIERGGVVVRSGLSSAAAVREGAVQVRGKGFVPTASIDVWLIRGRHFLGTLSADAVGAVRGQLGLPSSVGSGSNTVQLVERDCNSIGNVVSLGVRLDTLAELPQTGNDVNPLTMVWGVFAIVAGVITKRRRHIR